jgi:quercetin dioxygenase-like cupin family protein
VSALIARGKIIALHAAVGALEQVNLPVRHHFSRGVYSRELFIPQGCTLVGKIHKHSQTNICLKGHLSVATEDGVKDVKAGDVIVSPPGIKRAAYAHEDSLWLTVHGTDETDLEKLEDELIAKSFEEFDQLSVEDTKCLGQR